jgi:predicted dehydrogenase
MAGKRAIIIGTGGILGAWQKHLHTEGVQVVGAVDLDKARAQEKIDKFGFTGAKAYDDLGAALDECQADFALDLTTPNAHCAVVCAALEAGLHVIGEKPMCETIEQARQMVAAADKADRIYMVSQSRRYLPIHQQIADTVRSGAIGQITSMHCDFFMAIHFGGFRDVMKHVLLNDMSIHHFDLARQFIDADPLSVYAEEYLPAETWYADGPNANCLFTMTDNIRFTYRGSWCAEGLHTSWQGNWRIIGTKGTITYEQDNDPIGQIVSYDDEQNRTTHELELAPKVDMAKGQHGALKEFLAAIDGGPTPQGECHDNIKSMAMVDYAIQSADAGQRVDVVI